MSSVHVTLYGKLPELFKRKEDALSSVSLGEVDPGFQNISFVFVHLLVLDLLP